ncbi:MAG: hypothetical protein ACKVP3_12155 [Hyphomicrobiaceae bacterium]
MTDAAPLAVRACVFDAYGTLFDFASAAAGSRRVPADKMAAPTTLWRDKQLQYTWLRGFESRHADFWQVTGDARRFDQLASHSTERKAHVGNCVVARADRDHEI